jgi:hypothetical protein
VELAPGSVDPGADAVSERLAGLEGITRVQRTEVADRHHYGFELLTEGDRRADIFSFAVEQGLVLLELAPERTNLEEVFRRLTAGGASQASPSP